MFTSLLILLSKQKQSQSGAFRCVMVTVVLSLLVSLGKVLWLFQKQF